MDDLLARFLAALTVGVVIPLLILGLMVFAAWVLLARAQRDESFNIAEVFKDENKKVSSERVILLATWASSTWALAVVLSTLPEHAREVIGIYMAAWTVNNAAKYVAAKKYTPEDKAKEDGS